MILDQNRIQLISTHKMNGQKLYRENTNHSIVDSSEHHRIFMLTE